MKIEVGKTYRTRGGRIVSIVAKVKDFPVSDLPVYVGEFGRRLLKWNESGELVSYNPYPGLRNGMALVHEAVMPLTDEEVKKLRSLIQDATKGEGPSAHTLNLSEGSILNVLRGDQEYLSTAFTWNLTPQGYAHWDGAHRGLRELTNADIYYLISLLGAP